MSTAVGGPLRGAALDVGAIGLHVPRLSIVVGHHLENFPQLLAKGSILNRHDGLDALEQVAVHPVGGAEIKLAFKGVFSAVAEKENPRMLEEAADHRHD